MSDKPLTILTGDCRDVLKTLPDGSVNCCVTSVPYWSLRDYGVAGQIGLESTPEEWADELVKVFREVKRVLRNDATLWINCGDCFSSGDRATFRSATSQNKGQDVQNNMPRPKTPTGLKPKDLIGLPWRLAFALQSDGWWLRSEIIWEKPCCMPESVRDRPTKSHEQIFLLSKAETYYYNAEAIKEPASPDSNPRYARGRSDHHKYANGGPGDQTIVRLRKPNGWHNSENYEGQWAPMAKEVWNSRMHQDRDPAHPGARKKRLPGVNPKSVGVPPGTNQNESFSAAIKDTVDMRNKRSVWRVASFSYSGAHFACVDTETECLTIGGWKRYDELRDGMPIFTFNMKTGFLEFQPIKQIGIFEYNGNLVSVFGRSSNMLLTPNHRCVVMRRLRQNKRGKPQFARADALKKGMMYPVAANLRQAGLLAPNESHEFFELLGWFSSEGCYSDDGSASIAQSLSANPKKVATIDRLLNLCGEFSREQRDRGEKGVQIEWGLHGQLRKKVKMFLPDKFRIPEHFLTLPDAYVDAFLNGFAGGDGHIRTDKRITIVQKNKNVIDLVQAMYLRLGKSCILSQRGGGMWTAFISDARLRHFRNSKSSLIRDDYAYHGIVWCPSVLNGTWIARRGGRPFITGNTYPPDLIKPCILAGCPVGGLVLDPFLGSGTTAMVALELGRRAIGIELNSEYVELAKARCNITPGLALDSC